MKLIKQLRVYIAAFTFVTICIGVTIVGALGAVVMRKIPSMWDMYRYQVERFWAETVELLVVKLCLGIRVVNVGLPVVRAAERPLLLLGIHQGDLLHGVVGATFLRLAGGPVRMVVKKELTPILRFIMKLLGIAIFVDRGDPIQAKAAIAEGILSDPKSVVGIFPEGTRPTRAKAKHIREKYNLPWVKNTSRPLQGGVWTYLSGVPEEPRILFVSHRTEVPDWEFKTYYTLVGTTVEVRVRDISEQLNRCETREQVGEFLYELFEEENEWRGWS